MTVKPDFVFQNVFKLLRRRKCHKCKCTIFFILERFLKVASEIEKSDSCRIVFFFEMGEKVISKCMARKIVDVNGQSADKIRRKSAKKKQKNSHQITTGFYVCHGQRFVNNLVQWLVNNNIRNTLEEIVNVTAFCFRRVP